MTIKDLERLKQEGKIRGYSYPGIPEDPKVKRSKYGAVKVTCDNIEFHSKKERNRFLQLRMLRNAGEIKCLSIQVEFVLETGDEKIASYFADFLYYTKEGQLVVEDVKSPITRRQSTYKLKKKMVKSIYGIDITET